MSSSQIARDAIKHSILNNLSEHSWIMERNLFNRVNEELRTIKDKVYFTYRGDNIIKELNRLISCGKMCRINNSQKYYILVPYNKQLEIRDMKDRHYKIMREEMLKILSISLPKNS